MSRPSSQLTLRAPGMGTIRLSFERTHQHWLSLREARSDYEYLNRTMSFFSTAKGWTIAHSDRARYIYQSIEMNDRNGTRWRVPLNRLFEPSRIAKDIRYGVSHRKPMFEAELSGVFAVRAATRYRLQYDSWHKNEPPFITFA